MLWLFGLFLFTAPVFAEPGFDEKYERDYNIFNPANQYQPDNPLNPANKCYPDSAFNPANRFDPGNPVNRYNPSTPFAPLNRPYGSDR